MGTQVTANYKIVIKKLRNAVEKADKTIVAGQVFSGQKKKHNNVDDAIFTTESCRAW